MVIFLFLRNISATLIPGAAVPFSIIGTFAMMYLLGYSLNNLSLMALTLSVGFVVDDAIVMLENIVRHMEMGKSRMEAAIAASREIGFTILSMTFSLVAVFIPVLFMAGIVGRLLHEFSVTIVVAILISGFVSLSLTPMLGSRFLRSRTGGAPRPPLPHAGARPQTDGALVRSHACHRHAVPAGDAGGRGAYAGRAPSTCSKPCPPASSRRRIRISFSALPWGRRIFRSRIWPRHHRAVSEIVRAFPGVADVGSFVIGGNEAFFFANMKPRAQRALSVDQTIEALLPRVMAVPALFPINPEPAAHLRQRPVRRGGLPAHDAEPRPEGAVRVGTPFDRQDAANPRLRGRERRPAYRRAPVDGRDRPRPRARARRHRAADTGRALTAPSASARLR